MPGTITFRPIEANLTHNTDFLSKMNPYCAFIVGNQRFNSQICKKGGKHPHWNDAVTVPFTNESKIMVELMDKDKITKDDHIGSFMIDLPELEATGQSSKWYPLYYKNKPAGEILLEASIQGQGGLYNQQSGLYNQGGSVLNQGFVQEQTILPQTDFVQREEVIVNEPIIEQEVLVNQRPIVESGVKTYVEQRQTVEPHTFLKEVDVVETRPVQKTIEVMEPTKVLKEVQYTQAVPVRKQIETIEPQVVVKEVEVIEPRLVSKTIQVVENVPVMKRVEVIESVPIMKEVETFEPQTFTKTIEVTEQVPVMKTVTVTEPITLKKQVEFVEPIITTHTITKEIRPEIIVDEQVTRSVGPATYIGEIRELNQRFGALTLNQSEIDRYMLITEQQRIHLSDEEKWRWFEARRLSNAPGYGNSYSQGMSQNFGSDPYLSDYQGLTRRFSPLSLNQGEIDRYLAINDQQRLGLGDEERWRWFEARRHSKHPNFAHLFGSSHLGHNQGMSQNFGSDPYLSDYQGLNQRFSPMNLNQQEVDRYLAINDQQRLSLGDEDRWRWFEARRHSKHPNFAHLFGSNNLGYNQQSSSLLNKNKF